MIDRILNKERDFMNTIREFKESDFGAYVYMFMNTSRDEEKRFGRLVQVRKGAGVCGSDRVIIRHWDDSLSCHENQSFHRITDTDEILDFTEIYMNLQRDSITQEYTDCDKIPATGFLIEGQVESKDSISFSVMTSDKEIRISM